MANTEQATGDGPNLEFGEFHRLHRERLYRAVTSITREPDTADKAVDDAMAQAAQSWDIVSEYAEPAGWVFANALRKAATPTRGYGQGLPTAGQALLPDPDVNAAIVELPYRLRVVIVARFYLDWSAEQIADALHRPKRLVDRRLRRALKRIERALEDPS